MKNIKGLFLVLATLLAVTCLLISCNSEVANSTIGEEKGLSYITFGGGNSKTAVSENSVTISYDLAQIGDVYWVYTATKADHGGKVGETTGSLVTTTANDAPAKGLTGVIGPFSKGSWDFTLKGYKVSGDAPTSLSAVKGGTLVFTGSVSNVSLTTTSDGSADVTPIDITISLITSGTGVINLEAGTKFYWAPVNNDDNPDVYEDYAISVIPYIDGTAQTAIALTADTTNDYYKLDTTTAISSSVAAGVRAVKFDVVHLIDEYSNIVLNSCDSFNVTVYGGQTTKISATTVENQFSWGQFNGTLNENAIVVTTTIVETASAGSVSFTTDYTPASGLTPVTDSEKKTTVAVSGSLIEADNYSLSVTTSNLESANSKFTVAEGTSAVASIDLTLKKNNETVVGDTGFGENGLATVTTYIAKNLTSPTVYYGDDAFTKWTGSGTPTASSITGEVKGYYTYEDVTGKLVIYTVHFSEFYVTSTDEAYNATKGKAYLSLFDALDEYSAGDVIVLLKDIDVSNRSIEIKKSLTLNGNNKTITTNAPRAIRLEESRIDVTISDMTITAGSSTERGIQVDQNMTDVKLTLNNVTVTEVSYYCINLCSATGVDIKINGGSYTGYGAFNMWSSGDTVEARNAKFIGINKKERKDWNNFATIIMEGDTTNQSTLGSSDLTAIFEDCTISASSTSGNSQAIMGFNMNSRRTKVVFNNCIFERADETLNPLFYDNGLNNSLKVNNVEKIEWSFDFSGMSNSNNNDATGIVKVYDFGTLVASINLDEVQKNPWNTTVQGVNHTGCDYVTEYTCNNKTYTFDLDFSSSYYAEGYHVYIVETD